jgi:DNA-binding SARP family transcriptional activator
MAGGPVALRLSIRGKSVEFWILGAPEIRRGQRQLRVSAQKPLAVLVTGLLSAGRVVSTACLVDAVWGDDPPRTADALIQTYVSTLRRILGRHDDGGEIIHTRPPGYVVTVHPGQLDLHRFESLVAKGRGAAQQGNREAAAEVLREALALWRGPALDGLPTPLLRNEARRLDDLRLQVLEERIQADLACGRSNTLTDELSALVAAHPLRERLRGFQMLALYRSGRQADALESYREAQRLLRSQLGVDPGPELRNLHMTILRADPALRPNAPAAQAGDQERAGQTDARPAREATSARSDSQPVAFGVPVVPGQLPPAVADLTGRDVALAQLCSALAAAPDSEHPLYYEITGRAGSGKTALAVTAAHRVRSHFPDGQFFADLRDVSGGGVTRTVEVLGAFLRTLGVESVRLPDGVDERSSLLRTLLAGRRVLLLLDDASSEEQVRPLLPAHAGAAVLITSRTLLPGLEGRYHLPLDVLGRDDALTLLGRMVGERRVAAEPDAARSIVELCDRLPLAIRTAGARLAGRQRWPLAVLAARLRDEHRRLDELVAGDLAVRATLMLTYTRLPDPLRLAFRHLGMLGAPEFAPWVLGAMLDVPVAKADYFADQLTDAQLLDCSGVDSDGQLHYRIHDLIRLFSRERADAEDSPAAHTEAVSRLIDTMLDMLAGNGSPGARRDPVDLLGSERRALVAAVERASELGLVDHACRLSTALLSGFRSRNGFDEWWRTHDRALAAARFAGDRRNEAMLTLGLGQLRYEQDRLAEAADYHVRALALFRDEQDAHGEADALIGLAAARRERGELWPALDDLRRAEEIFARLGRTERLAECAYGIGYVLRETGEFDGSLAALTAAAEAYRAVADPRGEGLALRSVAMTHRAAGNLAAAADLARQSIEVLGGAGDELLVWYARQTLAKVDIRLGRYDRAEAPLNDGFAVCSRVGDQFGAALMRRTLGELWLATGDLTRAKDELTEARDRFHRLDFPLFRARSERDLAEAYRRTGDLGMAQRMRSAALATFASCGSREYAELTAATADAADLQEG